MVCCGMLMFVALWSDTGCGVVVLLMLVACCGKLCVWPLLVCVLRRCVFACLRVHRATTQT